jgi:hypothetical protein
MLLSTDEFPENRRREGCSFRMWVNAISNVEAPTVKLCDILKAENVLVKSF